MTPLRLLLAAAAALAVPPGFADARTPHSPFGVSLDPLAAATSERVIGAAGDPLSADAHFRLGVRYRAQAELLKAEEQFRLAAELAPSDSAVHLNLGIVLGEMGRTDEALASFERVLEIDPGSLPALFNRGVLLMRQGGYAEAISTFEKALLLGGDSVPVHYNLAVCYEYAGGERYGRGFEAGRSALHYRKVLAEQPDNAIARFNLGMVCLHGGDPAGAEQELARAAELDPGMADAAFQLGLLMLGKKSYRSAARHLGEARRLDPSLPAAAPLADAHGGMGQFYLDNADFENAQRHFEEALAFDPGRVQALVGLGRAERGLGDYAGAVRSFTSALASDEGLPLRGELADTYASWADDLAQRGEHADAAARYEYALRLRPDDLRCLKMLAALYRGPLGDAGKAIYLYRRALSSGGLSVAGAEELRKELAEAVREGRDIVDEYRLLVDRNPENATLRYNLGVFHHERNELDAAAEEYKRVIRLDPAHGYAHYNLGLIYQRKGMRSAALREFKLALHFRPGYHRAHYALGRFYEDLGAHAQAREEYARAIESAPGYAEAHLALGLLLRDRLRDEKAARDHLDRYRELKAAPESGEKGGSAASPAETAPRPSAGPS